MRLEPETKAALKAEAKAEGRTLTEVIERKLRPTAQPVGGMVAGESPVRLGKSEGDETPSAGCTHARAKVLHLKTCPDCKAKL